jgi:hypothetical protein
MEICMGYYTVTSSEKIDIILTYHEPSYDEVIASMKSLMNRRTKGEESYLNEKEIGEEIKRINASVDDVKKVVKLIVGITLAKNENLFEVSGVHAFIIYITDPYGGDGRLYTGDIMLDASGHYGIPNLRTTNSDIVYPRSQYSISIDSYRRYFIHNTGKILYTYSYIIDERYAKKIKEEIILQAPRDWLTCALEASTVLFNSGFFPEIKISRSPKELKKYLDSYTPNDIDKIKLIGKDYYDLGVYP